MSNQQVSIFDVIEVQELEVEKPQPYKNAIGELLPWEEGGTNE